MFETSEDEEITTHRLRNLTITNTSKGVDRFLMMIMSEILATQSRISSGQL